MGGVLRDAIARSKPASWISASISSRNDRDPATAQTVRIKVSASLLGLGRLLGGTASVAAFFRSGRGGRERSPRSEIPTSAGRHCRHRCSVGWFEWNGGQPRAVRREAIRQPCARRERLV